MRWRSIFLVLLVLVVIFFGVDGALSRVSMRAMAFLAAGFLLLSFPAGYFGLINWKVDRYPALIAVIMFVAGLVFMWLAW